MKKKQAHTTSDIKFSIKKLNLLPCPFHLNCHIYSYTWSVGQMIKQPGLKSSSIFFLFMDEPQAYTGRAYFLNMTYNPNITTKLGYADNPKISPIYVVRVARVQV